MTINRRPPSASPRMGTQAHLGCQGRDFLPILSPQHAGNGPLKWSHGLVLLVMLGQVVFPRRAPNKRENYVMTKFMVISSHHIHYMVASKHWRENDERLPQRTSLTTTGRRATFHSLVHPRRLILFHPPWARKHEPKQAGWRSQSLHGVANFVDHISTSIPTRSIGSIGVKRVSIKLMESPCGTGTQAPSSICPGLMPRKVSMKKRR